MMNFEISLKTALIIIFLLFVLFFCIGVLAQKEADKKENKNKKYILTLISNIMITLSVIIPISFFFISTMQEENDSNVSNKTQTIYEIEYMDDKIVKYNNNTKTNLIKTTVKKTDGKYENQIVIQKYDFHLSWICKVKTYATKYTIYLSDETYADYNRMKNNILID